MPISAQVQHEKRRKPEETKCGCALFRREKTGRDKHVVSEVLVPGSKATLKCLLEKLSHDLHRLGIVENPERVGKSMLVQQLRPGFCHARRAEHVGGDFQHSEHINDNFHHLILVV